MARVGEMMVIIRAEDFASRTLRRVSGELMGMSRAQSLAMKNQQLLARRQRDLQRIGGFESERRRLQFVQKGASLERLLGQAKALQAKQTLQASQAFDRMNAARRAGLPIFAAEQANWRNLKAQVATTDQAIQRIDKSMGRFDANLAGRRGLKRLSMDTAALGSAMYKNNNALASARGSLAMTDAALANTARAIRGLPLERLDNMAHAMSGLGRTAQLFGAVGTIAFGAMAKTAADFDTTMGQAATQARNIGQPFDQVAKISARLQDGFQGARGEVKGILDLMQQYPATADDMSTAAYDIFSSMQLKENGVINVAKGLGLLENANKIAVAGSVDLGEATNAMITVLNNFDPELRNITAQFDTMFDIVRFGRMRMTDFNVMMNKIAPAAQGAGQSLEDVGGAMAFLTEVMPSQRMVATGISRLLEAFQHPDIVAGLKSIGIESISANKGLSELIQELHGRGFRNASEFFRLISARGRGGGRGQIFTAEGRRVLNQLLAHTDKYIVRQREIIENQDEFNSAFQAQIGTQGVQWAIFVNQMKAVAIVIGKEAIPAFAQLGKWIQGLVQWFQSLNPETRKLIVQIGVISSIAAVLGGVFLAVFGSMLALEAMIRKLAFTGGAASGALGGLLMIAQRLAAIGVIILAIKVIRGGDMTGWDFLMAMVAGAALGARFGPWGALIGGITIPVTIHVIKKLKETESPVKQAYDQYRREFAQEQPRWKKLVRGALTGAFTSAGTGGQQLDIPVTAKGLRSFEDFRSEWARTRNFIVKHGLDPTNIDSFGRATLRAAKAQYPLIDAVLASWKAAKKQEKPMQNFFDRIRKAADEGKFGVLTEEQKKFFDTLTKGYQKGLKGLDSYEDKMKRFKEEMKQYNEQMGDWNRQLGQETERANEQALDSFRNLWTELQDINEQMMGTLFQGPWLTSETFDLAKEWGITPQVKDIIKDLDMQIAQFTQRRKMLDTLFKRGLPQDFLDELRTMTPEEAMPILKELVNATPKETQRLIATLNRRGAQIKKATMIDFTREVNAFRKAGVDMGEAIINGFNQAGPGKWFDNWIKATFPTLINQAVATAVAEWKKANPPPEKPKLPASAKPVGGIAPGSSAPKVTVQTAAPKTQTNTINFPGQGGPMSEREREARRLAFIAVNTLKGIRF